MGIYLQIGKERNVSVEIKFTTYRYFSNKNWKPFFYGPKDGEPAGTCWFGFLGLSVQLAKRSGNDILDCMYQDVNDAEGHLTFWTRTANPYDAQEKGTRRFELIETTDKSGVTTKLRDTLHERQLKLKPQ